MAKDSYVPVAKQSMRELRANLNAANSEVRDVMNENERLREEIAGGRGAVEREIAERISLALVKPSQDIVGLCQTVEWLAARLAKEAAKNIPGPKERS